MSGVIEINIATDVIASVMMSRFFTTVDNEQDYYSYFSDYDILNQWVLVKDIHGVAHGAIKTNK